MLKENWNGQLPFKDNYIERLVVDECESFSNAIPSNHFKLQYLNWLSVLVVEKCNSLEQVFDLKGLNADEVNYVAMIELNELHLINLPLLRNVWNKDPQGILSFENLTLLKIQNCSQLTHVFTLSVALGLENLQRIKVKGCSSVERIIIGGDNEIAVWEDPNFIFPSLKFMSLECLPSLFSFYSANGVLKCPSLKKIGFIDCPNMNLFTSTQQYSSMIVDAEEAEALGEDSPFFCSKVS